MTRVDPRFTQNLVCVPHTWHAAEMFLAILDQQDPEFGLPRDEP